MTHVEVRMLGEVETCARCGGLRRPSRWYVRGWEWLGHGIRPCIGADPEPHVSGGDGV